MSPNPQPPLLNIWISKVMRISSLQNDPNNNNNDNNNNNNYYYYYSYSYYNK